MLESIVPKMWLLATPSHLLIGTHPLSALRVLHPPVVLVFRSLPRVAYGKVTDTLSKVAVASEEVLRLLAARPTYTFCAMLTVWLAPSCTQFKPSGEPYMVNTFPLPASFIQFGRVPLPKYW